MDFYEIRIFHRCGLSIWDGLNLSYHSHVIPLHGISGNGIDLYEICIFPIDKTMERQYMASYEFNIVSFRITE